MSKEKFNLLVVAHPDDESIFFAGLLLSQREFPWKILCATDGNADGQGEFRAQCFARACQRLGADQSTMLGYADRFESRLPWQDLAQELAQYDMAEKIYTHGPIGEYGHPHHQDVCRASHEAFRGRPIFSTAYNCFPDQTVVMDSTQYSTKCEILRDIYLSETARFLSFFPCSSHEGFTAINYKEVVAIYDYLSNGIEVSPLDLVHYKWFIPYLPTLKSQTESRPF